MIKLLDWTHNNDGTSKYRFAIDRGSQFKISDGIPIYKFLLNNGYNIDEYETRRIFPGIIRSHVFFRQALDDLTEAIIEVEDEPMNTWELDKSLYRHLSNSMYGVSPFKDAVMYCTNNIKAIEDARKMNYTAKDSNYCTNDIKATEEVTKMNYNECSKKELTPHEKQMRHISKAKAMLGATGITKVIFNDMATIVFWRDGSKTVVKCMECDFYSKETAIAIAYFKHLVGGENYHYVMDALTGNKGEKVKAASGRVITIKGD